MKKLIVFLIILIPLLVWNYKDKIFLFFKQVPTHLSSERSDTRFGSNQFEEDGFINKYNVYINFENSFDKRARTSSDFYFGWANRINERSNTIRVGGVLPLYDFELKTLKEAIERKPKFEEVDDLMNDVLEDATTLNRVVQKAKSYYDKEDYKDDNFEKGKQYHKELVIAYDSYFESYRKMYVAFKELQIRFNEFQANKYKENGQMVRYHLVIALNKAKQVLAQIGSLEGEGLLKMDLKKFQTSVSEYRVIHSELEKLSSDAALKDTKEFTEFSSAKSSLLDFIEEGNDFIKECRNLQERIEKKDFSYSIVHPGIPDEGTSIKLKEEYFNMVKYYNRMN